MRLNDRSFSRDVFKNAAKHGGREDLSAHDLRRFGRLRNAQVATLTENMARVAHKTLQPALRCQHSESGRDAIVAANLSAKRVGRVGCNR
ncbi:hypothetical protein [Mycobacterium gastri]|uniref:hypothetical protein n=1 Tax=Mycobacterium gastri TaxID=1777 RepID=UPI00111C80CC|nr:hypothetical protein [Mycobacterium gastri]